MSLSIIPELMNLTHLELKDSRGIRVEICEPSQFRFNPSSFREPFLIVDNFEKQRYKRVEIKNITIEELKKKGYQLVASYTTPKTRNYPRQSKLYQLENLNMPIAKAEILRLIPKDHSIEFDITNNRIRIKGRNAFPYLRNEFASRWVQLTDGK